MPGPQTADVHRRGPRPAERADAPLPEPRVLHLLQLPALHGGGTHAALRPGPHQAIVDEQGPPGTGGCQMHLVTFV